MALQAKSTAHDVIILPSPEELPDQFREALRVKGYPSHHVEKIETIAQLLDKYASPVLLFNIGSAAPQQVIEPLRQLLGSEVLHPYPLVVLGALSHDVQVEINKRFPLSTTVTPPHTLSDVVQALSLVGDAFSSGRLLPRLRRGAGEPEVAPPGAPPKKSPTDGQIPPPGGATQQTERTEGQSVAPAAEEVEEIEPRAPHQLYERYPSIPALTFDILRDLNLLEASVGGADYPSQSNRESVLDAPSLPQQQDLRELASKVCGEAGAWGELHLYRTAFIAERLAVAMQFSERQRELTKGAALLFAMAFRGPERDLLKKNYLRANASYLRKDLCSRVKDAAMKLAVELKLTDMGNAVAALARLIGREESAVDNDASQVASLVMASDLTDRICFQAGVWNPRQAHYFLRRLKSEPIPEIHPKVLACLIKFLSEAVQSRTQAVLLPKKIRENPELVAAARAIREMEVEEHELKVPIAKLTPGMRLSRPMLAFDGREILAPNLVLDQDLIWRIWQLSAIRPLNAPVVVTTTQ